MKLDYYNLTKEDLPKEFKDRIERFNRLFLKATGKTFEEDELYEYEMGCIAQALSFHEYFEKYSNEEVNNILKSKGDIFELTRDIKSDLPYYDKGHSNTSLTMSWLLFRTYRERPELIPYHHGCLAILIGDSGYHDDRSDIPEGLSKK